MRTLTKPETDLVPNILPGVTMEVTESLFKEEFVHIFTALSVNNQTLLGYLADQSDEGDWYFFAPISADRLKLLRNGVLSIRDALTNSWVWQSLYAPDAVNTWIVSPEKLPEQFLPARGVPLLPEQEAILTTRAIGDSINLGSIPSSVISFVTEGTRGAMKVLLDYLQDRQNLIGRPSDDRRLLYDLPVKRFEFASFEVSFGPPDASLFPEEILSEATKLLQEGLNWATTQTSDSVSPDTDKSAAILRAVQMLTPPTGSFISHVQVGGSYLGYRHVVLGKESRRKIGNELNKIKKDRLFLRRGQIRELDRDALTFTLRDEKRSSDTKCQFSESLIDDVIEYFTDESVVDITGTIRVNQLVVTAIAQSEGSQEEISPPSVLP